MRTRVLWPGRELGPDPSPTTRRRATPGLAWAAVCAAGLAATLAAAAANDGQPGIGPRSWVALGLAALLAWRLTAARSKGAAALARTAGEWLAVVALLVLLAAPAPPPGRERPPADHPVKVEAKRRPQAPAVPDRSTLEGFAAALADAWRQAFDSPPTTRR